MAALDENRPPRYVRFRHEHVFGFVNEHIAENRYFDDHFAELLDHYEGQFVLIHEDALIGAYSSFDDAFAAGIQGIGNTAFLIRQVTEHQPPAQFPALALGLISAQLS